MTAVSTIGAKFVEFLDTLSKKHAHIHILTDSDADGLPAAIILLLALRQAGYVDTTAEVRLKDHPKQADTCLISCD